MRVSFFVNVYLKIVVIGSTNVNINHWFTLYYVNESCAVDNGKQFHSPQRVFT
jgi:hypothetical protein